VGFLEHGVSNSAQKKTPRNLMKIFFRSRKGQSFFLEERKAILRSQPKNKSVVGWREKEERVSKKHGMEEREEK